MGTLKSSTMQCIKYQSLKKKKNITPGVLIEDQFSLTDHFLMEPGLLLHQSIHFHENSLWPVSHSNIEKG